MDTDTHGNVDSDSQGRRRRKRPSPLVLAPIDEAAKRSQKRRATDQKEDNYISLDDIPINARPANLPTQKRSKENGPRIEPDQSLVRKSRFGMPPKSTISPVERILVHRKGGLEETSSMSAVPRQDFSVQEPFALPIIAFPSPAPHTPSDSTGETALPTPYSLNRVATSSTNPLSSQMLTSSTSFFLGVQSAPASRQSFERSRLVPAQQPLPSRRPHLGPPIQLIPREPAGSATGYKSISPDQLRTPTNEVEISYGQGLSLLANTAASNPPNNSSEFPFDLHEIIHNFYVGS